MAIEIVDLPIKMVIFHSYVSLPEGTHDGSEINSLITRLFPWRLIPESLVKP